jgi:hypothetical protein
MNRPACPTWHRRGLAASELTAILVAGGVLTTTAAIVGPRLLSADDEASRLPVPAQPEHAETLSTLVEALEGCKALLIRHDRERTPYLDLVVWTEDRTDPGAVNVDEVLVLSHSRMLQTLSMYVCAGPFGEEVEGLTVETLLDPDFPEHWRMRGDVVGRVLSSGVSEMRFSDHAAQSDHAASSADAGRSRYMVALTWGGVNADESDTGQGMVRLARARLKPSRGGATPGSSTAAAGGEWP